MAQSTSKNESRQLCIHFHSPLPLDKKNLHIRKKTKLVAIHQAAVVNLDSWIGQCFSANRDQSAARLPPPRQELSHVY